jgi:hypothetical protein
MMHMRTVVDSTDLPRAGDLLLLKVLRSGTHTMIEARDCLRTHIPPGSELVGVLGHYYTTDSYEGYVPTRLGDDCDLLAVSGVCGEVFSHPNSTAMPTRLRVLGAIGDAEGRPLNTRSFALPPRSGISQAQVTLVVGSSLNFGCTKLVGSLARGMLLRGRRVGVVRLTGAASSWDERYFISCGADPVLDFTHMGYPSTYMLSLDELLGIYSALIDHMHAAQLDEIIVELADGIFQRETRMLLDHGLFRARIDHAVFAASDSLAADCGARRLALAGYPLRAISGTVAQSPVLLREVEAVTGYPCLNWDQVIARITEYLPRPLYARTAGTSARTLLS